MYIVNVSGGAGSTISAHRAVERHGAEKCHLVFADTGSEHRDTYAMIEYMRDTALAGVQFAWLKKHSGDIWDFFDKHGMIRHQRSGCMASFHLKQAVLDEFAAQFEDPVIVTGLSWMEEDRIARFDKKKAPLRTWHPLEPRLSACQQIAECERLGYPKQSLYERGYPHNNCGGACVLAGISQWAGLYEDDPEAFEYAARRERQFQELHDTDFTILKDRRGGEVKSLPLYELKSRIDSGDTAGLREFRSTCSCMTDTAWDFGRSEMMRSFVVLLAGLLIFAAGFVVGKSGPCCACCKCDGVECKCGPDCKCPVCKEVKNRLARLPINGYNRGRRFSVTVFRHRVTSEDRLPFFVFIPGGCL